MIELLSAGPVRCLSFQASDLGGRFDGCDPLQVEKVTEELGIAPPRQARQVHGLEIDRGGTSQECDAFLLERGESALIRHADCFPVVVADASRIRAVLAHCGWRGALGGLAAKAARLLLEEGSRPEDLAAAIGPGISADSFEVGPEVLERFEPRHRARTSWGSPSVDLAALLSEQLAACGVRDIRRAPVDTFRDRSWHSFRRDGGHSARNIAICILETDFQPEDPHHPGVVP